MKKALLAGVAALFLAIGTAHAASKNNPHVIVRHLTTLPPTQYDKQYSGELEIVRFSTNEEVKRVCVKGDLACSRHMVDGSKCFITLAIDSILKARGFNPTLVLRHELGHCNDWVHGKNDGGRWLSANSAVQISLPAVVRELPAYPPVVCVTPDWKPEPCKSRSASTVVAKSTAPFMASVAEKYIER
jgi:hypothetical protein